MCRKSLIKTRHCCKSPRALPVTDTWSLAKSLKASSVNHRQDKVEDKEYFPVPPVLHVVNSYVCKAVIFQTYRLFNKSRMYKGKLAARMGKYATRTESMIKLCMFDNRDLITVYSIFGQSEWPCDTNEVSERMALWILSNLTKEGPHINFSSLLILIKVRNHAKARQ